MTTESGRVVLEGSTGRGLCSLSLSGLANTTVTSSIWYIVASGGKPSHGSDLPLPNVLVPRSWVFEGAESCGACPKVGQRKTPAQ